MHPALLDACFQAVGAHPAIFGDLSGSLLLPLGVRTLRAYGSTRNVHYCHARLTSVTAALASSLLAAGRDGATPVAVVENGSRPDQRTFKGRLDDLDALVTRMDLTGPALLFIGETAALAVADNERALIEVAA